MNKITPKTPENPKFHDFQRFFCIFLSKFRLTSWIRMLKTSPAQEFVVQFFYWKDTRRFKTEKRPKMAPKMTKSPKFDDF